MLDVADPLEKPGDPGTVRFRDKATPAPTAFPASMTLPPPMATTASQPGSSTRICSTMPSTSSGVGSPPDGEIEKLEPFVEKSFREVRPLLAPTDRPSPGDHRDGPVTVLPEELRQSIQRSRPRDQARLACDAKHHRRSGMITVRRSGSEDSR
jgi:hypothetical protein